MRPRAKDNRPTSPVINAPPAQAPAQAKAPAHSPPRSPSPGAPDEERVAAQGQNSIMSEYWKKEERNKKYIRSIDDNLFVEVVRSYFDPNHRLPPGACKIVDHAEGSYNYCVTVDLDGVGEDGYYVVRVPFRGTHESWTEAHAFELRTDVMNMRYISDNTSIRVPFVHHWDNSLDNVLGAPYTIMDRVEGVSAHENLWYDEEMWVERAEGGWTIKGDDPSPALERKRLRFLKDLAKIMVELREHQFDKMGALHIEDHWDPPPPTVGHYFRNTVKNGMVKRDAYSTTADFFQAKKDAISAESGSDVNSPEGRIARANDRMATVLCDSFPRSVDKYDTEEDYETAPETFVLAHPDFDLQNIFVDEEGNIISIIDWSGIRTVPRWAGWSSLPLFLRKDWDSDYNIRHDDIDYPLSPWKLEHYRKAYHGYLQEELDPTGTGSYNDGKYTLKSGAICAAYDALEYSGQRAGNIHRLLREIPLLHGVLLDDFKERLGSEEGWPEAEAMLKEQFKSMFRHNL